MGIYTQPGQTDVQKKAAIVDFLTRAASGGAEAIASAPKVSGPQKMAAIRSAIGGLTTETERLVNELVDAGTLTRNFNNSENSNAWTYSVT